MVWINIFCKWHHLDHFFLHIVPLVRKVTLLLSSRELYQGLCLVWCLLFGLALELRYTLHRLTWVNLYRCLLMHVISLQPMAWTWPPVPCQSRTPLQWLQSTRMTSRCLKMLSLSYSTILPNFLSCPYIYVNYSPISRPMLADLYSLSYLYFSPLGTIVTMGVGLIVSILTGN